MQEGRCRKIACLNFNQSGYKLDCFPSFHSSTSFHFVFVTSWHIFIKTAEKKIAIDEGGLRNAIIPCQKDSTISLHSMSAKLYNKWIYWMWSWKMNLILIHVICLSRLQLPTVQCLNICHNINIHKKPIKVQQTTICLLCIPTWLCRYAPLIS